MCKIFNPLQKVRYIHEKSAIVHPSDFVNVAVYLFSIANEMNSKRDSLQGNIGERPVVCAKKENIDSHAVIWISMNI